MIQIIIITIMKKPVIMLITIKMIVVMMKILYKNGDKNDDENANDASVTYD